MFHQYLAAADTDIPRMLEMKQGFDNVWIEKW